MASADTQPARSPAFYRLPLIGPVARAVTSPSVLPLVLIAVLLVIWGAAVALLGLPALFLPAVVASPLVIILLVLISLG